MPLKPINLTLDEPRLPTDVERFVRDAEARIERFVFDRRNNPVPAFVPSDFRLSYAALAHIRDGHLAPEMTMCEWGSGFGVTACLATQLGYEACGVEIERDLVDEARRLAEDHGLATEFAQGSLIPEGGDDLATDSGEFATLYSGSHTAYDELGLDPTDFGVIYAYPWPGEEYAVERLFEAYAANGALLVTYRGINQIQVHRKVRRSASRRR